MGKVILIGGNVEKGEPLIAKRGKHWLRKREPEILERILAEMNGINSRIEIITSASKIPAEVGKEYKTALKRLKCTKNVGLMHFTSRKAADKKEFIDRINACDGIILTGGDQVLLCRTLLKSNLLRAIKKRFKNEKDFLISGTSAGAMALADIMIADGQASDALTKGHIKLSKGLGILKEIIVDTHFIQRSRFGRLIEAVSSHPSKLGIGLGENTAVFFQKPEMVETIGANLVVLIDGSKITYNNIDRIRNNESICVEDLKVHILPKHHMFNITKKKIYFKPKPLKKIKL
ncbi:MAG: cyanophycinase [Bacteroidota bacterium]